MGKKISNRTVGSEKGIKRNQIRGKDAPDIALRRMPGFEHRLVTEFSLTPNQCNSQDVGSQKRIQQRYKSHMP
jgi:hypothetical protein